MVRFRNHEFCFVTFSNIHTFQRASSRIEALFLALIVSALYRDLYFIRIRPLVNRIEVIFLHM